MTTVSEKTFFALAGPRAVCWKTYQFPV